MKKRRVWNKDGTESFMRILDMGPMDSDEACRLMSRIVEWTLLRPIRQVLKAPSFQEARLWYHEARAAAHLMSSELLGAASSTRLPEAKDALERIVSDREWIGSWEDPSAIFSQLSSEILQVRAAAVRNDERVLDPTKKKRGGRATGSSLRVEAMSYPKSNGVRRGRR